MNERRRGLGRGLQALIPSAAPPAQPAKSASAASAGAATATEAPPGPASTRGLATAKVVGLGAADVPPVPAPASGDSGADVSRETSRQQEQPEPELVAGAYFAEIEPHRIRRNPRQPRAVFDEEQLAELVASIKEVGLLQPIVVRAVSAADAASGGFSDDPEGYEDDASSAPPGLAPDLPRFELVMGERRWRACQEAGLDRIPTIVRATDDQKMLLDALLENLHRAQLNPLEEAAAYDQLIKDFACTHEELADRIGRSRSQVSNTLRLMKLSEQQRRRVAAGVLSAGHARALLGLEESGEQDALAQRIVQEQLSVREVEDIVRAKAEEEPKPVKSPKLRAGSRLAPQLRELSDRLRDRFETTVKVDLGARKGKIVVEFASVEDLERILETMAPGEGRLLRPADTGSADSRS